MIGCWMWGGGGRIGGSLFVVVGVVDSLFVGVGLGSLFAGAVVVVVDPKS